MFLLLVFLFLFYLSQLHFPICVPLHAMVSSQVPAPSSQCHHSQHHIMGYPSTLMPGSLLWSHHHQKHLHRPFALWDVNEHNSLNLLISADVCWNLGLAGTLSGSVGAEELDVSHPDSNIPNELQVILSSSD
jgi:hypothetical protein